MRNHPARNHRGTAFTLIELLVVISIIALLIAMLLPALSSARRAANVIKDRTQMQQIGRAIFVYASDSRDFAPVLGGLSAEYDAPGGDVAGAGIWGINPGYTGPGGFTYAPNGAPMGIGVLVPKGGNATAPAGVKFGDYLNTVDILFSPLDRGPTRTSGPGTYKSFWELRAWFGDQFSGPGTPWTLDGQWGYYDNGSNYYFDCSYTYRGSDYSWYDPAISTTTVLSYQTSTIGASDADANKRLGNRANAKTSSQYFAGKSIMMTKNTLLLDPSKPSVNVMRGDGSVNLVTNPNFFTQLSSGQPQNWYYGAGYFDSKRFALVDYFERY